MQSLIKSGLWQACAVEAEERRRRWTVFRVAGVVGASHAVVNRPRCGRSQARSYSSCSRGTKPDLLRSHDILSFPRACDSYVPNMCS